MITAKHCLTQGLPVTLVYLANLRLQDASQSNGSANVPVELSSKVVPIPLKSSWRIAFRPPSFARPLRKRTDDSVDSPDTTSLTETGHRREKGALGTSPARRRLHDEPSAHGWADTDGCYRTSQTARKSYLIMIDPAARNHTVMAATMSDPK